MVGLEKVVVDLWLFTIFSYKSSFAVVPSELAWWICLKLWKWHRKKIIFLIILINCCLRRNNYLSLLRVSYNLQTSNYVTWNWIKRWTWNSPTVHILLPAPPLGSPWGLQRTGWCYWGLRGGGSRCFGRMSARVIESCLVSTRSLQIQGIFVSIEMAAASNIRLCTYKYWRSLHASGSI